MADLRRAPDFMTLTQRERRLIARLSSPSRVQLWLNELPYNTEDGGETLRSFRGGWRASKPRTASRRRSSRRSSWSNTATPRS